MNLEKFTNDPRVLALPREMNRGKYTGLPIPWDADGVNPSISYTRVAEAHQKRICGICGTKIRGRYLWLIVSPDPETRKFEGTSESPMHRSCAALSLYLCPVLSKPSLATAGTWGETHVIRCTATRPREDSSRYDPIDPVEFPVQEVKKYVKRCPYPTHR